MPGPLEGLKQIGNINLYSRPRIKNPDDSVSTVRSMSFGADKGEILVPTVSNTGIQSDQEAIDTYNKGDQHLGIFDSPRTATTYANALHEAYARGDFDVPLATSRKSVDPVKLSRMIQGLVQSGPYRIP